MPRNEPERTCVGCRAARPKSELARVVRRPDGAIVVDPSGKMEGRGAYICPTPDCLDKAVRRKGLERGLKAPVPPEAVERLRTEIVP
jgi:predicted RNA-binding protein YlxR (DUF448 family)